MDSTGRNQLDSLINDHKLKDKVKEDMDNEGWKQCEECKCEDKECESMLNEC